VESTSSSIFTADRFSDFSDGCYTSGPFTYTTNSVVSEGVLASTDDMFPLGRKLVSGLSDNVPLVKRSLGWVLAPTSSMKVGNPV
jgi:hypothetical protein